MNFNQQVSLYYLIHIYDLERRRGDSKNDVPHAPHTRQPEQFHQASRNDVKGFKLDLFGRLLKGVCRYLMQRDGTKRLASWDKNRLPILYYYSWI